MRLPIRVLSDLHLGHEVSRIERVEQLRGVFTGIGSLVLNGDTWEEMVDSCRSRSAEMLEELKVLGEEMGVEMYFIRGNHDPQWTSLQKLELAGGKILVVHGDALMRDSSPWKPEILNGQEKVRRIWERHPRAGVDLDERLEVAREIAQEIPSLQHRKGRHFLMRVLDAVLPPTRAMKMLHAWWGQARFGFKFCRDYAPQVEVLVIGHFHRHGWWRSGDKVVVNTGSFVLPSRAYWVDWDGVNCRCGQVVHGPGGFGIGEIEYEKSLGAANCE